jgi:aspartate beta-hydroxylase
MSSLYGNPGYRAFVAFLALQVFIFVGLLVVSVAPAAPTVADTLTRLCAFWIVVAALAGFLDRTWSVLAEAAFCLGYFEWKKFTKLMRPVLLLAPVALIANDMLLRYGVAPTVARLPLLIVSAIGVLASAFALYVVFYLLAARRWRNRLYGELLSRVTEKFGAANTRRLLDSINYERGITRGNPFPMKRGLILADLPSSAWYSDAEFSWKAAFINVADKIRAEAMKACLGNPLDNYNYPGHIQGAWNAFWLVRGNAVAAGAEVLCPETLRALRQVPGFPYMTEAFFSVLKPNSRIMPHCDESNLWINAHFGIDIPEDCGIRVGRETRKWQQGEFLFFDTNYEHEAWNNSERPRVVLLFDFLKPALNEAEREFALARQREFHRPAQAESQ